jgi:hypothetical protein
MAGAWAAILDYEMHLCIEDATWSNKDGRSLGLCQVCETAWTALGCVTPALCMEKLHFSVAFKATVVLDFLSLIAKPKPTRQRS